MGRNTLSTTALAHKLIADLQPLSAMLAPNERRVVEKFFDTILQQRVAIAESAGGMMPKTRVSIRSFTGRFRS